ncbi:hypothetical protein BC829DRAFT_124160 [Chytridium lagenaria]|nr:hypothetical protein BC829DRAFT_124160 [Chytridium lagenaria]
MHREPIKASATAQTRAWRDRFKSQCLARVKSSREEAMMKRRGLGGGDAMDADGVSPLNESPVSISANKFFESEDAAGVMMDGRHPALKGIGVAGNLLSEMDREWVQRMIAEEWGSFSVQPMDPDAAAELEREILEEVQSVTPGPWVSTSNDGGINEMAIGEGDRTPPSWAGVTIDAMGNVVEAQFADHEAVEMRDVEEAVMTHYEGMYSEESMVLRSTHQCPVCLQGTLWSAGALFGCDDCNLRMRFKVCCALNVSVLF